MTSQNKATEFSKSFTLASVRSFSKYYCANSTLACGYNREMLLSQKICTFLDFRQIKSENKRPAHQKVYQLGSIHVIDHMPEKSLSYLSEILSFHRIRHMHSTAFRDAKKSGHGEGIFKIVCNV